MSEGRKRTRSTAKNVAVTILALAAFVALLALGTWQVERRSWKLALIEAVDARSHAAPTPAPGPDAWGRVTSDRDVYRHVVVHGTFQNDKETLVQAVTDKGPGFWVLTPLATDAGWTVLVNRGFVPPEKKLAETRTAGQVAGPTALVGLLRISEPGGGFLRSNAPAQDRWFSRDVAAIATARGIANAAPYFIDADASANPGGYPIGGLTVIAFPNSHLVYAITWYSLAVMLVIGFFYGVRETRRDKRRERLEGSAPPESTAS